MLERADHRLDVAAYAPELSERLRKGRSVAGQCFKLFQGVDRPCQCLCNFFGVARDPDAAALVERRKGAQPTVHRLGEAKQAASVIG